MSKEKIASLDAIKYYDDKIKKWPSDQIGQLGDLETTAKDNVVSAVNELVDCISDVTVNVRNMTETTVTIDPNVFYIWGEVAELDITLAEPSKSGIYNEYMFQFTSGSTATTLSLPAGIVWFHDNNVISANKTYQISIVNNLAILGEF